MALPVVFVSKFLEVIRFQASLNHKKYTILKEIYLNLHKTVKDVRDS